MSDEKKYKVTSRETGEVHYLTAAQLARMPKRGIAIDKGRAANDVVSREDRAPHVRGSKNVRSWPPIPKDLDRNTAIKLIRDALRKRSGKAWSVTGGRGTAYGWIEINAPPARRRYDSDGNEGGSYMGLRDRRELARLLDLRDELVHPQGESIAASGDHRLEYIARARGVKPERYGVQYWD